MAEPIEPREVAEQMIKDAADEITYQQIRQHVADHEAAGALSAAERTALTRKIDDLVGQATVTVTFPGQEDNAARIVLLNELLDHLDDKPVPGSPIRYHGEEIWLHTTGQVEGWLRTWAGES